MLEMINNIKYTDEYLKDVFKNDEEKDISFNIVTSDDFYLAVRCAVYKKRISVATLQRLLSIGYGKAAKLIDLMDTLGLINYSTSLKGSEVLSEAQRFLDEREKYCGNNEIPLQIPNGLATNGLTGKEKCKILKSIRKEIANANGIEYEITECTFKGDCAGFCPKCDSEIRYLERELQSKSNNGEKIRLTGLAYPSLLNAIEQEVADIAENSAMEIFGFDDIYDQKSQNEFHDESNSQDDNEEKMWIVMGESEEPDEGVYVFPDPDDLSVCKIIKSDDPLVGRTLKDAIPLSEKKKRNLKDK